jgi:cold shock CspA family protein
VQGTIKDFDQAAGTGSVLTDDRREVAIDEASLAPDAVLMLRFGQRVRFEIEERDGRSVARGLRVVTFP